MYAIDAREIRSHRECTVQRMTWTQVLFPTVRRVDPDRGNANCKGVPYYECFIGKHGGQRGYKGHVLSLPQDIQSF